ncbi:putative ABC transport system ATP-binding protein [Alkaliphilus peptidifermentans DSM 18978]|uniref:Putative ABC transport system ATP-binding protein n=2 Tax=Alkaliphilus TaxID=114627 RepID=A0A1G5G4Y7_9FIRM|nr:putative ABC transport system ATP-binding protein [Alkaliphilus peptidifermentans DSM 18978]
MCPVRLYHSSFTINKGEFVGIMGPSGSGKTTLLNILSGVDKGTSGEVFINNKDISSMKKDAMALFRRKNMGYIFQDFNLLDSLTVQENIALPLILDKENPKLIENKVNDLMNFFNIKELKKKYPYNISGGEKQRVAAARALINDPDIIFADEPTGNLDSKSANNIMNIVNKMNEDINSTVLMVTHDPFASSFCKRVVFIKDGQVKMEIISSGDRKKFFDKILEVQSIIGGIR